MLVMGAIGEANYYTQSEENLTAEGYAEYLAGSNSKAQFFGKMLDHIPYSPQAYTNLYNGMDSTGKHSLIKKQSKPGTKESNHRPGYDIVSTFDKSFSLLYQTLNEHDRQKFNKIVRDELLNILLNDVARELTPQCKKSAYQNFDPERTEINGAVFQHFENRGVDPHWHLHANIFNFAKFYMNDGTVKTLAIDPLKMFRAQKMLSAKLDFNVAQRLEKEFGIVVEAGDDSLKIQGITQQHTDQFNNRRDEVLEQFEAQQTKKYSSLNEVAKDFDKSEKAAYIERVRRGTADHKQELSYDELMTHFDKQLAERTPDLSYEKLKQEQKTVWNISDIENMGKQIIKELTENKSIFRDMDLNQFIYRKMVGRSDIEVSQLRAVMKKDIVELENGDFTSKQIIKESFNSREILASLKLKPPTPSFRRSELKHIQFYQHKNKRIKFNDMQREAMLVATNEKRVSLIVGDAGTGKTSTVIAFSKDYYKNNDVWGLSTQGLTAGKLTEAGIDKDKTNNLEKFFTDIENNKITINKNSVLIVDEAGMVSAKHYEKLLTLADEKDCKLILVGDAKQLSSVGAGNMFASIESSLDTDDKSRLSINQRQKTDDQKQIAEAFRDQKPEQAIEILRQNNDLHLADKREDLITALADKYFNSEFDHKDKIVIAFKNADVNEINDKIRSGLIERGLLNAENQVGFNVKTSGNSKLDEKRYFVEGDNIVLNKNLRATKEQERVDNGTLATIVKIDNGKITCKDENDKQFIIDTKQFNNFSHSFCVSTYKSQGSTKCESFIFGNPSTTTSNSSYVDFSRHQFRVSLFIGNDQLDDFIAQAKIKQDKFDILKSEIAEHIYKALLNAPKPTVQKTPSQIKESINKAEPTKTHETSIWNKVLNTGKDLATQIGGAVIDSTLVPVINAISPTTPNPIQSNTVEPTQTQEPAPVPVQEQTPPKKLKASERFINISQTTVSTQTNTKPVNQNIRTFVAEPENKLDILYALHMYADGDKELSVMSKQGVLNVFNKLDPKQQYEALLMPRFNNQDFKSSRKDIKIKTKEIIKAVNFNEKVFTMPAQELYMFVDFVGPELLKIPELNTNTLQIVQDVLNRHKQENSTYFNLDNSRFLAKMQKTLSDKVINDLADTPPKEITNILQHAKIEDVENLFNAIAIKGKNVSLAKEKVFGVNDNIVQYRFDRASDKINSLEQLKYWKSKGAEPSKESVSYATKCNNIEVLSELVNMGANFIKNEIAIENMLNISIKAKDNSQMILFMSNGGDFGDVKKVADKMTGPKNEGNDVGKICAKIWKECEIFIAEGNAAAAEHRNKVEINKGENNRSSLALKKSGQSITEGYKPNFNNNKGEENEKEKGKGQGR